MKTLLLCFFTCGPALFLSGQDMPRSVIGSAGAFFSDPTVGTLHFTLGEIAVSSTTSDLSLNRGFHQGYADLLSTSIWSAPEIQLAIEAYPNPTADRVTLTGDWESDDRLAVRDLFGRTLLERRLVLEQDQIDLSPYPPGTYLLTLTRAGRPLRSLRVIRQ